jgi:hypothetical protein
MATSRGYVKGLGYFAVDPLLSPMALYMVVSHEFLAPADIASGNSSGGRITANVRTGNFDPERPVVKLAGFVKSRRKAEVRTIEFEAGVLLVRFRAVAATSRPVQTEDRRRISAVG